MNRWLSTEEEMAEVFRSKKPFCSDLIMSNCRAVTVLPLASPHRAGDSKENRETTSNSLLCLLPAVLFLPFAK